MSHDSNYDISLKNTKKHHGGTNAPYTLSQKPSNRSVKAIKSQREKVLITTRWHSDTVAYDI